MHIKNEKSEMASSITIFFADCRYKEKRGLKKLCTLYMHSLSSLCVIQRAGFGQIILFVVEKFFSFCWYKLVCVSHH